MALNNFECKNLMPLHFKGLKLQAFCLMLLIMTVVEFQPRITFHRQLSVTETPPNKALILHSEIEWSATVFNPLKCSGIRRLH